MTVRLLASVAIALATILSAACTRTAAPSSSEQAAHASPSDALTPIVLAGIERTGRVCAAPDPRA